MEGKLPPELAKKLNDLGEKLIQISEKEVNVQDAVMVSVASASALVFLGTLIKAGQIKEVAEKYNTSLGSRFANLEHAREIADKQMSYREYASISAAVLLSTIVAYFPRLYKLDIFNSDKTIKLSTNLLPTLGNALINISNK